MRYPTQASLAQVYRRRCGDSSCDGAMQLIDHYVWGYGERQAVEHWNSIFSEAEHKNATEVKDIDSIVQALAETFEFVVTDQ